MSEQSLRVLAGLAAIGLSLGIAWAASDAGAVVDERQATMKDFARKTRVIKNYADGEENRGAALEAAQSIRSTAARLPSLFPEGTSLADLPNGKTYAKPDIWKDNARFRATAGRLATQAQSLEAAIERSDRRATATQLGELGRVGCGACHETFRAPLR